MRARTDLEALLLRAASSVRLLAAVTPANAAEERARLLTAAESGGTLAPRWRYSPPSDAHEWLGRALAAASEEVPRRAPPHLAALLLARIEELDLERRLALAVGSLSFARLARGRFGAATGKGLALAKAWAGESPQEERDAPVASDAAHPASLLWRMRARVVELGLPFRVEAHPALASLAATGDTTIYVACARPVTDRVARRTVLHETLAHALPRHRARAQPLALFELGAAGGQDDQEGYALWLEETHGHLDAHRRRELAARHLVARAMRSGASFHDAYRVARALDLDAATSVRVAERVYRGSDGASEGLGREAAYLSAYARVRDAIAIEPTTADVLGAGLVSVRATRALASLTGQADTPTSASSRRSV